MGGGGVMMAANQSLKTNREQLSKRKDRKALEGSYANIELGEFPEATDAQLQQIKDKMQHQNRITTIKLSIVLVIIITAAVALILSL